MKRLYMPGEEWLYMKLYMGPENCDYWLSKIFPDVFSELLGRKLIQASFFIRYLDPSFHLRLRFKLRDENAFGEVIHLVRNSLNILIDNEVVWRIQIESYDRELERFGEEWIEYAERIFDIDSRFWLSILPVIRGHEDGENLRWKAAFLSVHRYFDCFSLDMESRIVLISKMAETLRKEMDGGKRLRLQIDEKYRKHRYELGIIIKDPDKSELSRLSSAFQLRSNSVKELDSFEEIIGSWETKIMQYRVSDLIHLSLNRGLRSKHRMHELVIYSFLKELYTSSRARGDVI